jgi:HlyD family secretion protein
MKRLLVWLLILAVLVGGAAAAAVPARDWWQQRTAPKFLTAKVSRGRVETVVNSTGTVKPVRTVSVGAFTSGPVKYVYVDFNSEITKPDQELALIDDRLQAAAVARDRAAVLAQEADRNRLKILLKQAEINEARAKDLAKAGKDYISATDLLQFETTTETLKAQVQLADASIDQAKATLQNSVDQLNYTKVRGPGPDDINPAEGKKGKVIERKVDPGQTVAASFQTPELFIVGLEMDKHMHVYASVDEADVGLIEGARKQNRRATFTVDSYPGELFDGEIRDVRLNSTTTQNVVTYPVIIDAPNHGEKLKPGMTANITFPIEAKEDVLRIPAAALRFVPQSAQVRPEDRHHIDALPTSPSEGAPKRSADEKAEQARKRLRRIVWVQDGLLLRAVPVTLGLIDNQNAEVVSGDLADGQAVVTGVESPYAR